jgi:hypothetical protein
LQDGDAAALAEKVLTEAQKAVAARKKAVAAAERRLEEAKQTLADSKAKQQAKSKQKQSPSKAMRASSFEVVSSVAAAGATGAPGLGGGSGDGERSNGGAMQVDDPAEPAAAAVANGVAVDGGAANGVTAMEVDTPSPAGAAAAAAVGSSAQRLSEGGQEDGGSPGAGAEGKFELPAELQEYTGPEDDRKALMAWKRLRAEAEQKLQRKR